MAGRIHVLWPDEIWDLWGEREAKKEGRWSIESARVAQFTTYQAAVDYLTSCELYLISGHLRFLEVIKSSFSKVKRGKK